MTAKQTAKYTGKRRAKGPDSRSISTDHKPRHAALTATQSALKIMGKGDWKTS